MTHKIIEKIRKCLALSTSANEHEAASALRQAQKLMERYGITDADVIASSVDEREARAGAYARPAVWESALVSICARTFGCRSLLARKGRVGYWRFIGVGSAPEVCQYAFEVLARQIRKKRSEFIKSLKCKRTTKVRRADIFCGAFVVALQKTVKEFSGREDAAAIEAFIGKNYPDLGTCNLTMRGCDQKTWRVEDYRAAVVGQDAARDVSLLKPVHGDAPIHPLLTEQTCLNKLELNHAHLS
jgi:hypothetical protein